MANINRLKTIKMLSRGEEISVGDISEKLNISLKATSQHLIHLKKIGALQSNGRDGHVYYYLKKNPPKEFSQVIKLFI